MNIKHIIMCGSNKVWILAALVLLTSCDVSRKLYMEESGKTGTQLQLLLDGVEVSSSIFLDKVILNFKNTEAKDITVCLDSLAVALPDGGQCGLTTLVDAQYYKGANDRKPVFRTYKLYMQFDDDCPFLNKKYLSIMPCSFLTNRQGERIINDTIKVFLDPRYPWLK